MRGLISTTWHWHGNNSTAGQSEHRPIDQNSNQGQSVVFWDILLSTVKAKSPDFSHLPDLVIVSLVFISHSLTVYSRSVSKDDGFQSDCFTDMRNSVGGMFSPDTSP